MRTGVYELTTQEYLNDDLPGVHVPALSASIAKILDAQSPRHAYARHPKLGGAAPRHTDAMDEGTALHSMLLGAGREVVLVECEMEVEKAKGRGAERTPAVVEFVKPNDYRTNAAKARRDAIRAAGAIPFLAKDFDRLVKTASALRENMRELGVPLDGEVEQVVLWTERADDGTEVVCKAMFDLVDWASSFVLDLKSCDSAHPDAIANAIETYGYSIQHAAYRSAMEALGHRSPELLFLFLEREAPHVVTPADLRGAYRELGESRWRRAVNLWARCLHENRWPGYVPYGLRSVPIEPKPWAMTRDAERAVTESLYLEMERKAS